MAEDASGITGEATIQLIRDGVVIHEEIVKNIITTPGDEYYAKMGIAGVNPAAPAAPTKMTGMKLGTGTTAAAKSGAGGALITYLSGSNVAFDTAFPAAAAVAGTDTGWTANYQTTWAAGVATNAAITEAVIVNDSATNLTSSSANTISRITFTAINKLAGDALVIGWKHKFLGA
jgi:hypothetical protein